MASLGSKVAYWHKNGRQIYIEYELNMIHLIMKRRFFWLLAPMMIRPIQKVSILKPNILTIILSGFLTAGCSAYSSDFQSSELSVDDRPPNPITQALTVATQATSQMQTAQSVEEWDQIAQNWTSAIALLHSIPSDSPQRLFAQRKAREYHHQLSLAQDQTTLLSFALTSPDLGSQVLNEQLANYVSYRAAVGTPDVLIVGSSRALQGVDARQLEQTLANQGVKDLQVYNFSVNGITAQGVRLILEQFLIPTNFSQEQLPQLILWVGNSRMFNSARPDRTYQLIVNSPGYQTLQSPGGPSLEFKPHAAPPKFVLDNLDTNGFLPVNQSFNPASYYQKYPRVSGQYDSNYQPFSLTGVQSEALGSIVQLTRSRQIPLVLVTLPLSQDYLDSSRLFYERQFQSYLQNQARVYGFTLVNLLEQWLGRNEFFADPSHLNQRGAEAIAQELATHPQIPWNIFTLTN